MNCTWRKACCLLLLTGGCTEQVDTTALGQPVSTAIVTDGVWELMSPLAGEYYEGGVGQHIPLHGVTRSPRDEVVAQVFDYGKGGWVDLSTSTTAAQPVVVIAGQPYYAFDMGIACTGECEASIPLHAWTGFGPFLLRLRFFSTATGALTTFSYDDCVGNLPSVEAPCLPLGTAEIDVISYSGHDHAGG